MQQYEQTRRFAFEAFLPREKKERAKILEDLKTETRTIILYEAPHHLIATLQELREVLGNRAISLCRELTKKHEEIQNKNFYKITEEEDNQLQMAVKILNGELTVDEANQKIAARNAE